MQKWELSQNMYTLHTRFRTLGTDLYAQPVLINKISASELSRKFIKSVLLVGMTETAQQTLPSRILYTYNKAAAGLWMLCKYSSRQGND